MLRNPFWHQVNPSCQDQHAFRRALEEERMKQRRVTMRACPWSGSDCSISSIWPTVAAHRPSASFFESMLVSVCLIKLRTGIWLAAATVTARAIADGGFFCLDPLLAAILLVASPIGASWSQVGRYCRNCRFVEMWIQSRRWRTS